jgi:hypothetical protein
MMRGKGSINQSLLEVLQSYTPLAEMNLATRAEVLSSQGTAEQRQGMTMLPKQRRGRENDRGSGVM